VLAPFLDELAARSPERSRPAIDRARAGRFAEAAQAITARSAQDPALPFLQGLSLLSQKQLQPASDAFREALRASPDFMVGAFYIGACYAAGGRDPQAVNAWQTSLVALDGYPVVFTLLAEAFIRLGQADRALETLDEAAAKWPDDANVRLRLARAAFEGRRYDRLNEIVDAALGRPIVDPEVVFTGMQAIFEQATAGDRPVAEGDLARLKRYREAYIKAGGSRRSLVDEWVAALEKKGGSGH